MKTPKDIVALRNDLLEAYTWVKDDPRRANQVKEMVNAAGKVISSIKTQLEYALLRGEMPEIEFMGAGTGRPIAVKNRELKVLKG